MTFDFPQPGYSIRRGSTVDKALLVKFIQRTYQELFPDQDFSHLSRTIEQYFSIDTPLWWVYETEGTGNGEQGTGNREEKTQSPNPIACLWAGNAIDQVTGCRHAHIFLLYVVPSHRRRGIGTALMQYIENWAKQRGDRQLGLQVFASNTPALNLYQQLGYQTQSLWMIKLLHPEQ
ncbi:GNAT family N-acetyltransferase [Anabaena sp. UHCC 0451]|uniref:GNAT family N-acetyltransferase n=1 Tax=Anabaena sp. UHCC 0451 TaxID=2055235 RepID=UPI002B20F276|nr:GNAT family N-acetyltransferase [Anabaena sp. UHCC 0451]MEA5577561.1 GNAT family N-acetyltransferase [Anabaena sp. UHCC 0451]